MTPERIDWKSRWAHCARTLHSLSISYTKLAIQFPNHAEYHLSEARRLRKSAHYYMGLAWQEKDAELERAA